MNDVLIRATSSVAFVLPVLLATASLLLNVCNAQDAIAAMEAAATGTEGVSVELPHVGSASQDSITSGSQAAVTESGEVAASSESKSSSTGLTVDLRQTLNHSRPFVGTTNFSGRNSSHSVKAESATEETTDSASPSSADEAVPEPSRDVSPMNSSSVASDASPLQRPEADQEAESGSKAPVIGNERKATRPASTIAADSTPTTMTPPTPKDLGQESVFVGTSASEAASRSTNASVTTNSTVLTTRPQDATRLVVGESPAPASHAAPVAEEITLSGDGLREEVLSTAAMTDITKLPTSTPSSDEVQTEQLTSNSQETTALDSPDRHGPSSDAEHFVSRFCRHMHTPEQLRRARFGRSPLSVDEFLQVCRGFTKSMHFFSSMSTKDLSTLTGTTCKHFSATQVAHVGKLLASVNDECLASIPGPSWRGVSPEAITTLLATPKGRHAFTKVNDISGLSLESVRAAENGAVCFSSQQCVTLKNRFVPAPQSCPNPRHHQATKEETPASASGTRTKTHERGGREREQPPETHSSPLFVLLSFVITGTVLLTWKAIRNQALS